MRFKARRGSEAPRASKERESGGEVCEGSRGRQCRGHKMEPGVGTEEQKCLLWVQRRCQAPSPPIRAASSWVHCACLLEGKTDNLRSPSQGPWPILFLGGRRGQEKRLSLHKPILVMGSECRRRGSLGTLGAA